MANRRVRFVLAVVATAALSVSATDALSQQVSRARLGGGADLSVVSQYIWRGYVYNDDVALQPDVYLSYGNFLASVWGSMDMTDRGEMGIDASGDFTEIDYVVQYRIPTRLVDLSFGYSYYSYPNIPDELRKDTQELFAKGTLKLFSDPTKASVEPGVEMYVDIDEVEGWYGRVFGTYTQPQGNLLWKLRASVGFCSEDFANYYFGGRMPLFDSSSFCDLEVRLFTTLDLGMNFGLTPFIAINYILDSEIRDAYNENGEFFGGLSVSWAF
jgi:hypothetical protein